jgi:hypothetical protein
MPVEGHWARVNVPVRTLTRRERRTFGVLVATLAVAALVVVVWAAARGGGPTVAPGCLDEFAGSTMGAVRVQACGADAARTCRAGGPGGAPLAASLARACARAGYASSAVR